MTSTRRGTNDEKVVTGRAGAPSVAPPRRVLIVDDEPGIQRIYKTALDNYGFVTTVASDGRSALACCELQTFDIVVTDVHMPGCDGIAFLRELRKRNPSIPVIVISGRPLDSVMTLAVQAGAFRYLVKPILPSALRQVIETALQRRAAAGRPPGDPSAGP